MFVSLIKTNKKIKHIEHNILTETYSVTEVKLN